MAVDYKKIYELAEKYKPDMTKFLRDMIAIPSESCNEKDVVLRIKKEMEKVGFDKIEIDPMGNILGYMGHGKHLIAMDAHIDTVGVGDISLWKVDPYKGAETDNEIIGRGGSDQEGGMASMVYAGKIIKELGLEDDYTLLVVGSVSEEDCDGLCWQYIIEQDKIKPEFVLITEPTDTKIYRGHRGRMEIKMVAKGISCHGSAPERGDNAIFKMAKALIEVEQLNSRLKNDDFLGKGTVTASQIYFTSPSRCAVADSCTVSLDRRLTVGETWQGAIEEIKALSAVKTGNIEVTCYDYDSPSYTGLVYPSQCYFPTWVIPEDHIATQTLVESVKNALGKPAAVDKWTFSTNGVSIMGRHGIPCIGYGPGLEKEAHAPNEKTFKDHLVNCAAVYAIIPLVYCDKIKK